MRPQSTQLFRYIAATRRHHPCISSAAEIFRRVEAERSGITETASTPAIIFGANSLRSPDRAILIVTHYQRMLDYITPDYVHVMIDGRIVKTGNKNLALELEECAAVDGASSYRIFWSIVIPVSSPGLVATFLFVLVFAWNEYLLALFLSSANAQTMPLTVAAQNATRGPQWWYMSVLILIMIIPVIGMAMVLERFISRGLLVGAVKG